MSATFGQPLPAEKRSLLAGFERRDTDQIQNVASGPVRWDPAIPESSSVRGLEGSRENMDGFTIRDNLRASGQVVYTIADLEQLRTLGLIPKSAQGKPLFAWGDVLRNPNEDVGVRLLVFAAGQWEWNAISLRRPTRPMRPLWSSEVLGD